MNPRVRRKGPLDRLSAEQKAVLAEHAFSHSLEQTHRWLTRRKKSGKAVQMPLVEVSLEDLGQWLIVYRLRRLFRQNASIAELMIEESRRINPDWTDEELQAAGQSFFSAMALNGQNPRIWVAIQRLALQRDQLALSRERFKEQLRSKLALGLDAVARAFLGHPTAMDLYRRARAMIQETIRTGTPGETP